MYIEFCVRRTGRKATGIIIYYHLIMNEINKTHAIDPGKNIHEIFIIISMNFRYYTRITICGGYSHEFTFSKNLGR